MRTSLAAAVALLTLAVLADDNPPGVVIVSDQREGRLIGKKLALLSLLGIKTTGLAGAVGTAGTAATTGLAGIASSLGSSISSSLGGHVTTPVVQPAPAPAPILILESKHRETYYPVEATIITKPPVESYYVVTTAPPKVTATYEPVYVTSYPSHTSYPQSGISASISVDKDITIG